MDDCVGRVIVGVSGSVGSLQALRRGVGEARLGAIPLYAVFAWTPPGGEAAARRPVDPRLLAFWEGAAWGLLQTAWDEALGGYPSDVDVRLLVARGTPGRVLVNLADDEKDLLVIGAGSRNPLRRALVPSVSRYCVAHAPCPVLAVPPSPLARQLAHGVLPGVFRRRRAVAQLVGDIKQP